ncbi:hypothetical protein METHB2_270038 [Candidatus Methylobacter favarea]|uniref:Uncharacterized protein n=1 Tax=Candidatus Methylobacter favarea TaxID=2707345 RepID=A0A8S0X0N1_9GAMM|nr:hypothetical protein METHB2_270038 [Candidatus Methylobacter favarea]
MKALLLLAYIYYLYLKVVMELTLPA